MATKKPGEIVRGALYTLDELNDRLGLGKATLAGPAAKGSLSNALDNAHSARATPF